MIDEEISRLSRLTAILTRLQSTQLITSTFLSEKFGVSKRTIYRDIKALQEAGVPVYSEEGRGYSLMPGYRLPPVMFSQNEANALVTAEKIIAKNKDASLIKHYSDAITKIKAILKNSEKSKADLLSERVLYRVNPNYETTSDYLSILQAAITNYHPVDIDYISIGKNEKTNRVIEPFALYNSHENWVLIAWCRLRKEFRAFRLDKMIKLAVLYKPFTPHDYSLQQYFEDCRKKNTKLE